MRAILSFFCLFVLSFVACQQPSQQDNLIVSILADREGPVQEIMSNPEQYELQILYTQIDRDSANRPHFRSYSYRLDDSQYFYPASTVKLPAAVLALEKIRALGIDRLTPDSPMLTDSAYSGQSRVEEDSTSENGLASVAHYVKKILLVSDNDAFNRLYEFLGQGPLNQSLNERGWTNTRLTHRLSIFLTPDENRYTNPIRFIEGESVLYEQPAAYNSDTIVVPASIPRGKGYMRGGKLISEPMEFANKNFFPLQEQQELLKSIIFPNDVIGEKQFHLLEEDYQFLYQYLSQLPKESNWPSYDPEKYWDSYVKFLLFGDTKDPIPAHIRIFNKIGVAYGTITENAYVVDFEKGIEFLLSATIFVNQNKIFNDNTYEYDELGIPFMAELGRAVYEHELQRKRKYSPDLSRYQLTYDR